MSNMYIVEPPTSGKVVLTTDAGDIDIELWCKECPKTCRNFIQLCQEGYFDGTIFHRIIKNFMVQGGDPTGSGQGGESIYGRTFKDEFHQRLKFSHRGQVAMANGGPNDNSSQFFITLDKCEHLNRKNTIFGKVTGNTIFNVLQMAERAVDANDRPEEPIRIIRTETLLCPFDDIIPRELFRIVKATKNFGLISFGEEAEEDEVVATKETQRLGKIISSHDSSSGASQGAAVPAPSEETSSADAYTAAKATTEQESNATETLIASQASVDTVRAGKRSAETENGNGGASDEDEDYDAKMRAKVARERAKHTKKDAGTGTAKGGAGASHPGPSTREERIAASKEEARRLRAELARGAAAETEADNALEYSDDNGQGESSSKDSAKESFLEQQRRLYASSANAGGSTSKKSRKSREDLTMAILSKFKSKLSSSIASAPDEEEEEPIASDDEETDAGWMSHALKDAEYDKFGTQGIDPSLDPNTLAIEDPRNPMVKRRREQNAKDSFNRPSGSRRSDSYDRRRDDRDRDYDRRGRDRRR